LLVGSRRALTERAFVQEQSRLDAFGRSGC
jgi:hypothetical protein